MFELDEAKRLGDAAVDFIVGDVFFGEAEADVVADGEGVKERALLKDGADIAAQGEEVALLHFAEVVTEERYGSGVRLKKAIGEFEQDAFSDAGRTNDDAVFTAMDTEGDVIEDGFSVKTDGNMIEDDDLFLCSVEVVDAGLGDGGHRPKTVMKIWVMKKSVAMMMMEATTTAWVVERPTPCVPPRVDMPK